MTFYIPKKALLVCATVLKPQSVFATSLYTGNGGTQTITNGLDLAGKGGLVWVKERNVTAEGHRLRDTQREVNAFLQSNTTGAEQTGSGWSVSSSAFTHAFTSNGSQYVAWSFRRAKKFFDTVTYTGNGVAGRQIPHGLGIPPGLIIIKRLDSAGPWRATFFGLPADGNGNTSRRLNLNTSDAAQQDDGGYAGGANGSIFIVSAHLGGISAVNATGATYVAYLFAHNPDLIDCGSVNKGSGAPATKATGWPVQFLLLKNASTPGGWYLHDTQRGFAASGSNPFLTANTSNPEASAGLVNSTPTGFTIPSGIDAGTYLYLAIRAPT